MRRTLVWSLGLLLSARALPAQALSPDSLFDRLVGRWVLRAGANAFDPAGIGRGNVVGDSVPFLFRYTATTSFHNTFVYSRAADSWQWHLDNDSLGARQPFARVTLTRR